MEMEILKPTLWSQFGASIDMLENCIAACPDVLWGRRDRKPQYWYVAYHALFWLDFYLTESSEGFTPPKPFTLSELDPAGRMPERIYTKSELRAYLEHCREKCISRLESLTDEIALQRCAFPGLNMSVLELHFYNTRHVQHHAGQLAVIIRGELDQNVPWATKSKS